MSNLVPGRSCGPCTVCCTVPPVDTPAFKKTSGETCQHCISGGGCAIYETRPPVCREWFCGWRHLPHLGEDLRPDLCGVMVVFEQDEQHIPAGFTLRPALKFVVFDGRDKISNWNLIRYINGLVYAGAPVFLAVPGPPGHFFAKTFMNAALGEAVKASDGEAIRLILLSAYDRLAAGAFERVEFETPGAGLRFSG